MLETSKALSRVEKFVSPKDSVRGTLSRMLGELSLIESAVNLSFRAANSGDNPSFCSVIPKNTLALKFLILHRDRIMKNKGYCVTNFKAIILYISSSTMAS